MTRAAKLIDALNGTFGRHNGFRASHAKGFAVTGRFIPMNPQTHVQVPLLRAEQSVAARFSVGGGKPGVSDKSPTVRGIGLTIGGASEGWTLALISAPVFFANSAQQFEEFLFARVPDPAVGGPDPEKVKAFNAANPNTVPHQEYLKATPPCRCYSTERYHSGHAYTATMSHGNAAVRLLLEPERGRIGLTNDENTSFPDDYLYDTMRETLSDGPVRWVLKLVVANPDDELLDPTVPWTGGHKEISVGILEIDKLDASDNGEARVYDPVRIPQGVGAPRDDVFGLRSAAYAESRKRRTSKATIASGG